MNGLREPELHAKVDSEDWDGDPSRCEDAEAFGYFCEALGEWIVVIVCPHCDGGE